MSLDDDFGSLVQPWRMGDFEDHRNPVSHMVLDADTASALRELMECVSNGCRIAGFLTGAASFLWLVNEKGEIIFAVEEMLDARWPDRRVPNLYEIEFADHWHKLGHPSLVRGRPARIGGEIYFDDTVGDGAWILNNKSARYGLRRLGRTFRHLVNVAEMLRQYNIKVHPNMIDG